LPKDLAPVYIVSHTHWDREWYWPFRRFRVNLERVVHQVLEELESDPEFRHFLLDGQAVLLEDYLGVRPEDRRRLAALVQAGKLAVGPWYVLPDEFLVSGEATVRNLLTGHRIANAFGACQKVGYLPDSFGHIAQLPQILRRAGIDSFVFTRGHGDEAAELGLEFTWRAPDGSEVLAVHQCEGYCNAGSLGHAVLFLEQSLSLLDAV
jgi:mannosylglycerate hydrolase